MDSPGIDKLRPHCDRQRSAATEPASHFQPQQDQFVFLSGESQRLIDLRRITFERNSISMSIRFALLISSECVYFSRSSIYKWRRWRSDWPRRGLFIWSTVRKGITQAQSIKMWLPLIKLANIWFAMSISDKPTFVAWAVGFPRNGAGRQWLTSIKLCRIMGHASFGEDWGTKWPFSSSSSVMFDGTLFVWQFTTRALIFCSTLGTTLESSWVLFPLSTGISAIGGLTGGAFTAPPGRFWTNRWQEIVRMSFVRLHNITYRWRIDVSSISRSSCSSSSSSRHSEV